MKYFINLDTRLSCAEKSDQDFLASRLFVGIHKAIVQECDTASSQKKIAVTFPAMDLDAKTVGPVIRVFANDPDVLGRLMRHSAIHRFALDLRPTLQEVPLGAKHEIFSRDRAKNPLSPSAVRRRARRAIAAGRDPIANPPRQKSQGVITAGIEVASESNGNRFAMDIRRASATDAGTGEFNAYGLSVGGATPAF